VYRTAAWYAVAELDTGRCVHSSTSIMRAAFAWQGARVHASGDTHEIAAAKAFMKAKELRTQIQQHEQERERPTDHAATKGTP